MKKLLILCPTGSTGRLIFAQAIIDNQIEVVAACDLTQIGKELGSLVAIEDPNKILIKDVNNLQEIINETKPDVVVDFTVAKATDKNCLFCVEIGFRCVIGTTAMSKDFLD